MSEVGLTAFIKERLDEDEQVALSASDWEDDPTPWALLGPTGGYCEPALHIHRRRLLAEVDAKRRILREHDEEPCSVCIDDINGCPTRRALAGPYAGHPDYDPAWRNI